MPLLEPTGKPKIVTDAGQTINLPYPDTSNFMQGDYQDESIVTSSNVYVENIVGERKLREVFNFGYRYIDVPTAAAIVDVFESFPTFTFIPRSVGPGDNPNLIERSFRVRVTSEMPFAINPLGHMAMDITLEALSDNEGEIFLGSGTVFAHVTAANSGGSGAAAGTVADGPGIYRRLATGAWQKVVDPGALTIASFDLFEDRGKIVVAYTNYQIWTYDYDGSDGQLIYTIGGSTIGVGEICVMRNSELFKNKVYVRHGTGPSAWSVIELDLVTATTATYGGSGSFSFPKHIAADAGKMYYTIGSTLAILAYHNAGTLGAAIGLVSNGYAGISQNSRGLIHVADRVYFAEYNGFNWSSIGDTAPQLSSNVVNHAINGGINHVYDPINNWVWKSGNGVVHTSGITTTNAIEMPLLVGASLLTTAEFGSMPVNKVVPVVQT